MYCLLCKKHDQQNPRNKSKVWNVSPSVRIRKEAIQDHLETDQHKYAVRAEMLQRVSVFQKELDEKKETENEVNEKVFHAIYYLIQEEISNTKLNSLLNLMESLGINHLKYFQHRSNPSIREMFLTLGKVMQDMVLEKVKKASVYGLLIDEATDVSVVEQLDTFVKYVNFETGTPQTDFLSIDVLDDPRGPCAQVITDKLVDMLNNFNLKVEHLASLVSDGESVMLGKTGGVAAKLKELNHLIINFHCICHRLALACAKTGDKNEQIKTVEETLNCAWRFFENSPKRTTTFTQIQLELAQLSISQKGRKQVARKFQKACRTRWLSLEQSINSTYNNYVALLHTFKELKKDPVALGLFRKFEKPKFLYTVYIMKDVLPILSSLSKTFQTGSLNFSQITPGIENAKSKLKEIRENKSCLKELEQDLNDDHGRLSQLDMNFSESEQEKASGLIELYIDNLVENINFRFGESVELLSAFSIFNPMAIPEKDSTEFKIYGNSEILVFCEHFFKVLNPEDESQKKAYEQKKTQLQREWDAFKYNLITWKEYIPESVKKKYTDSDGLGSAKNRNSPGMGAKKAHQKPFRNGLFLPHLGQTS